jgi:hypothetical protein
MVDQKHKVIGINTVSMGSLTASVVHPREVMKPAILSNAAALLLCHNHPSGAPQPSQEDRALTKRLVDAGKLLGIAVLDHIIVGDGKETYFRLPMKACSRVSQDRRRYATVQSQRWRQRSEIADAIVSCSAGADHDHILIRRA